MRRYVTYSDERSSGSLTMTASGDPTGDRYEVRARFVTAESPDFSNGPGALVRAFARGHLEAKDLAQALREIADRIEADLASEVTGR